MLSKGIMVLALLALVYLLLITMNANPLEQFIGTNKVSPANIKKTQPKAQPKSLPDAKPQVKKFVQPKQPVEEEFTQEVEPVINYQENFEDEAPQGEDPEDNLLQGEDPEDNLLQGEDPEDNLPQVEDPEDLLIGQQEAQLHFTDMFFQSSTSDRNVKNPTYDLRGETEIPFNPNYAPFNSSASAGKPLSNHTLTRN